MTPTKLNFDPNAPLKDGEREIPDAKKNFVPGESLKFSPNLEAKKNEGVKDILGQKAL